MRTLSTIARYLTGVIFSVFGLNGFLNFIPLPPPGGIAGQFTGALYAAHYLWLRTIGGGRAGAGDRQHSYFPRFDGSKRAPAGPRRSGTVGADLRRCETSFCGAVPAAAAP